MTTEEKAALDRLLQLEDRLGLGPEEFKTLADHREMFVSRAGEFGRFFYEYFEAIPQTRLILETGNPPRKLEEVLGLWFRRMFTEGAGESFLAWTWKSGLTHVNLGVDQRYVNLGYSAARRFCHELVEKNLSPGERGTVLLAVDKLIDLCVLAATDSYIATTARCDLEVVAGIAHQVRNPVTVIGGNISRLQKKASPGDPSQETYRRVLAENRRLERMVSEVVTYSDLYKADPELAPASLAGLLREALGDVRKRSEGGIVEPEMDLDPEADLILGDRRQLVVMFSGLLENALEAADPKFPLVRVAARPVKKPFVEIGITNNGASPPAEVLEHLSSPFSSTKPLGTGFGLPTAVMVARRNLGRVGLEALPDGGARALVHLVLAREASSGLMR